ncbi:MAG: hypothetical protein IKY95_07975 [Bacteroidales bacterium]|nr:hypothetical protein [Bacteroidales bacterium]
MKSIKEIENMSLEELIAVSSDEATAVPEGFAERIGKHVEAHKIAKDLENDADRTRTVRWIGAAAAVTLLAGTSLGIVNWQNQPKDTFDDPYLAYAELEKAFATMSDSLQKGLAMADKSKDIIDRTINVFEE